MRVRLEVRPPDDEALNLIGGITCRTCAGRGSGPFRLDGFRWHKEERELLDAYRLWLHPSLRAGNGPDRGGLTDAADLGPVFRRMRRKSYFANTVTMMGGTAVAQGITFLGTLILARFYLPSHFGVFSMFTGLVSLISVWSSLRYEIAVTLPERDEDAAALVQFSILIVCFVSLLILVLVIAAGHQVLTKLRMEDRFPAFPASGSSAGGLLQHFVQLVLRSHVSRLVLALRRNPCHGSGALIA